MRRRIRVSRGLRILLAGGILLAGIGAARHGIDAETAWAEIWPWAVVMAAAALHELGHLIAAGGVGVGVRGLALDVLGARMELAGTPSYGQELFVAAGGPFISLVSAALVYPRAVDGGAAEVFFGASLVLGLLNLIPAGTLDGGRMLTCGAAYLWGVEAATALLRITTALCLGALWMLSIYGLLRGGAFLSAFGFSLCLLWRETCGNGGE